jgi:hypothetical protein
MVTEVLDPPKPGKNAQDYDAKRLREGLKYADSNLRTTERKLSPLGMRAILLYKDAVANLLDLEENREPEQDEEEVEAVKEAWLTIVRMHEESAQYKACLAITNSSDAQTLQDEIVKLQRIAFFARYGDAFADTCQRLRAQGEAQKVLGRNNLVGGYWTGINKRLIQEKEAWEKVLTGANEHGKCPTHMAISEVCRSVGFNIDEMLALVQLYATRNQIVHTDLAILIKNGQFDDLKKRLYNDFCDIPRVISAVEGLQAQLMSKLLQGMMDRWFIPNKKDPDNLQLWKPTEELEARYNELQDQVSEGDIYKKMVQKITVDVAKRLNNEAQEKGLVEKLNENFGLASGNKKVKRVASAQLQEEVKRAKTMEQEWKKLMNMADGIRKVSDTYVEKYGALDRPPTVVHDPLLD